MTSSPPPPHHYQINTTAVANGDSASTTATSTTAPWSSETNWTVSRGSLDSAVTFESFDFPIDSEFSARKPPLILVPPPSPDLEPCEIKLNFTQKHEIRQVYVRSTARVYEIYYAPALQSDNEYLCTVRCSAASEEDNFFPATDIKDAIPVNLEDPNEILPKRSVAGENITGANEDDWVEIKIPVGRLDEGNTSSPNGTSKNSKNYQNYFEATAEMNDLEPCMSLTLRLLSLQSKDSVYVDEVYVFAEAIDTNDSENLTVNAESSAGTSLMTMLVPTLLGLSKSRSLQSRDQHGSKPVVKPIETEPEPIASIDPVNLADPQDEKLLKQGERNDFSYGRAESLLEQLVSRVSRIEDICMRFEEKMLKPINSMEERLLRVERQVELLAKNTEFPLSPSCSKSESNHRSISDDGCGEFESEEKGSISNEPNKPTQVHQGLMATAQETPPCDEKEEVNDFLESPKKEKPKKPVSIDDALAAALAGFSSLMKANDSLAVVPFKSPEEECLTSSQMPIHTSNSNREALISSNPPKATACEFAGEENGEATKANESLKVTAPRLTAEEHDVNDTVTSPCLKSSIDDDVDCVGDSTMISRDGSTEIPDNRGTSEEAMPDGNYASDAQLVKQDSIRVGKISDFDKDEILKCFPDQPPSRNGGEVNDGSESSVDFESPILEVKFTSLENGSLKSHLADLLSYTDDPASDACNVEENTTTANNLLVELEGEGVQQDLSTLHQVTSFESLI